MASTSKESSASKREGGGIYGRGALTASILQLLNDKAMAIGDIADVLLPGSGYKGSKTGKDHMAISQKRRDRHQATVADNAAIRSRQRLHSLLYYLEQQGIVTKRRAKGARSSLFSITPAGKEKHSFLAKDFSWRSGVKQDYISEPSDTVTIVVFDILERDRKKRDWLRSALKAMRFKMVQRSVWAGRCILPTDFIHDIEQAGILPSVMIARVEREGMFGDALSGK